MARIRTIKPEFWTDEKIVELSAFARLLFIGIWNFCDDEGRMPYSPKRMKMQIFPSDDLDCQVLADELARTGQIIVYQVAGKWYLQVVNFDRHQKIDKRGKSKLPPPPPPAPIPAEPPRIPPNRPDGREKEKEGNSVSTETGDGSPPEPDTKPETNPDPTTKDELWAASVSLLVASNVPEKQCRSFVGGLVKQYGNQIVVEAVRAAVVERPADAVAFLKAACMARKQEGGKSLIPWHATDAGVTTKGDEVGLHALPGESMAQFKARLIAAIDGTGKPAPAMPPPVIAVAAEPKRVERSPEQIAAHSASLKAALKTSTTRRQDDEKRT